MNKEFPDALCKHCGKWKIARPRGLCWKCYYTPGVKDLYPPTSKYAQRGRGHERGHRPEPEFPTKHLPGSSQKVNVLIQRCIQGQSLWHPDDAEDSNV